MGNDITQNVADQTAANEALIAELGVDHKTAMKVEAAGVAETTQTYIEIDKDFPIPHGSHRGKYWAYYDALDRMEVGDSFEVNDKALIDENLKGKRPGRPYEAPLQFTPIKIRNSSKNKPGPKYVARWTDYGNAFRVWRRE